MDELVEGPLGLVELYQGPNPTVDIVAVHGLGANPSWAWIRKVAEGEVNWLADQNMLPAKIPNARIMTFNYESRWHKDAPKQRRSLCADQLLSALDNKRKEEKGTAYRPIIFVGHSFGGIVIEQALVNAISRETFQYLAKSTVGIIFLGTPHRGTHASKWGELIAISGKKLGFGSEDRILKDLREDSEALTDLLYNFTLWLSRMSVPTVCFFEQHKTDYGKKFGFSWTELVVEEKSACIDGHRKEALPTDHLKINKYCGPGDLSYKRVYPIIKEIAENADKIVQGRLKPRTIVKDNSGVPHGNTECLQSLFLTNPLDDLAAIRRLKGERVEGTCEWVLVQKEYTAWLVGDNPQLLRLIGAPGIGKTMISSFLVDELERNAQQTSAMILTYYFCDNKDEKRNGAIAILRGLLLQILRQRPILFKHIRPDYDLMRKTLFDNLDALWRILLNMLNDSDAGGVYILVDALDECEKSSRQALLTLLVELFIAPRLDGDLKVKFLITHRPEPEIEETLRALGQYLRIHSGKIDADLAKFINIKVDKLSKDKRYPKKLVQDIKDALRYHAGGTFLWVSLVLDDISKTKTTSKVRGKLQALPSSLVEVYSRILNSIDDEYADDARFILQLVVVARRPLTVGELAMALALGQEERNESVILPADFLDELKDDFKCCEPLLFLDDENETVNLVHQSVKDYLFGEYLHNDSLSQYHVVRDKAEFLIFQICWRYLTMEEFDRGNKIISRRPNNTLHREYIIREDLQVPCFQYAFQEWQEHALAASSALLTDCEFNLDKVPTLRDAWLLLAAAEGQEAVVRWLLEKGAQLESKDGQSRTSLSRAAKNGKEAVVKLLLQNGAEMKSDNKGKTPLWLAARNGHEAVVDLLLENGADTEVRGGTLLAAAIENGSEAVIKLLLAKGAKMNHQCTFNEVFGLEHDGLESEDLLRRLRRDVVVVDEVEEIRRRLEDVLHGDLSEKWIFEVMRSLVEKTGVKKSMTPLLRAAEKGNVAVVRLLLEKGAEVNARSGYLDNALQEARQGRHQAVVRLLEAAKQSLLGGDLAHLELEAREVKHDRMSSMSSIESAQPQYRDSQPPAQRLSTQTSQLQTSRASIPVDTYNHTNAALYQTITDQSEAHKDQYGQTGAPFVAKPSLFPKPHILRGQMVPPSNNEKEAILANKREEVLTSSNPEMQLAWAQDALLWIDNEMQNRARLAEVEVVRPGTPQEDQLRKDAIGIANFLADQRHPKALFIRATWHEFGKFGYPINRDKAIQGYRIASESGSARAEYRIGTLYEGMQDMAKAIKHYKAGVALGDAASNYRLGMISLLGHHDQVQDQQLGVQRIRYAAQMADENSPQGAYVYGMLLARELPNINLSKSILPIDIDQARDFIEKAAYLGFAKAQLKMGAAYELCQLGCDFNPALSLHYNALAAHQGEVDADMSISKWFLCGYEDVFEKNGELAFKYARRAAHGGLPTAEFAMGYFYEIGMYVPSDLTQAKNWYQLAADHGNKDATGRLESISQQKTLSKDHEKDAIK